jgi:hypothetical protein
MLIDLCGQAEQTPTGFLEPNISMIAEQSGFIFTEGPDGAISKCSLGMSYSCPIQSRCCA